MNIQWFQTTTAQPFFQRNILPLQEESPNTLQLTGARGQTLRGFGGCFNELGYLALAHANAAQRQAWMQTLFSPAEMGLCFCRIPIGASDYAAEWYSCDETEDDYALRRFSIARDRRYLIPYIREAQAVNPNLQFFASPWSPPTWMKKPKAYNYGTLRMEPKVLAAYAHYLQRFVQEYRQEGIPIVQVHVQNEPFADQKFPSCRWSAEAFRVFIGEYLGPVFEKDRDGADIFLGTFNGPEEMTLLPGNRIQLENYNRYVDSILFDPQVLRYVKGIGYQWAGRTVIDKTHLSFPELELIQTENECGDGTNSWAYAQYMFSLMCHYFRCGVTAYVYWNFILEAGGESTWGWKQNSMATVEKDGTVLYQPEFYVMKHFARFVRPGAAVLGLSGHWSSAATAFENRDGSRVLVMQNALDRAEPVTLCDGGRKLTVELQPRSFHTFVETE
ncbi:MULTISPECIES: glycoside hydrolase family 30 protein [Caproicibacterium]|uniref:Glycoside hydrolase family 30 beta sandwich domain-containing protein n=1 Tax=Caproicibacterium argilliputei TaxID=3030016 RepID=A0AA97H1I2_9FIRM|nr:glycoside hydrolase family 30 beta sandwich domain-containing protein [Caproicibacterium argilliputei]WOC31725.1 glycoside hydrolase family 30 beta sandwich domain-containing protein [Caproicibacterium argilliputei]